MHWKTEEKFINVAVIFALLMVILALIAGVLYFIPKHQCSITAEGLNLKYDYSVGVGCRVNLDGKLIPVANLRYTQQSDGKLKVETE